MNDEKNKKTAKKRRSRKQQNEKRHLRIVQRKRNAEMDNALLPTPPMADISAPDGFRAVSMSQALAEFTKPLINDTEDQTDGLKDLFGVSNAIWNYEILENQHSENSAEMKDEVLKIIEESLGIDFREAEQLLREMLARKRFLFPEQMQPEFPMIMFMRKELSHLITPFNYGRLSYSAAPIQPDRRDFAVIEMLKRMDHYIVSGVSYDEWEDFFFFTKEEIRDRFEKWVNEKNLTEWSLAFSSNVDLFLNFVYLYTHDDPVTLKTIIPEYLEEFFFDYLLRKLIMDPHGYVTYPSALKFFYRFLQDKYYADESESRRVIEIIDELEPEFVDVLRVRFG